MEEIKKIHDVIWTDTNIITSLSTSAIVHTLKRFKSVDLWPEAIRIWNVIFITINIYHCIY